MQKKSKVLLVPHGKRGLSLENVAFNLDSVSSVFMTFLAVIVKQHPYIKNEMIAALKEVLSADLPPHSREVMTDALGAVEDLMTTDEEFVQ
jgi:hypothetical protein